MCYFKHKHHLMLLAFKERHDGIHVWAPFSHQFELILLLPENRFIELF